MKTGIEFTLKNGEKVNYDPVKEFTETELLYKVNNGYYTYDIVKEDVVSYRQYNCCAVCDHGLDEKGNCRYCEF